MSKARGVGMRNELLIEDLNPTFLFTWKGTRTKGEDKYHKHDFLEMAFVLSGSGRYHIGDRIYDVTEGDLIIMNPGVKHQALFIEGNEQPSTEFFVGFSDIQIRCHEANHMPLQNGEHVLHTTGELRQRLFKLCSSMEAENAVCRPGRYFMLKSYLMQMILIVIREQYAPVKNSTGYSFESVNKKYVVEQIVNYFEDHYNEKISLDQIAENMYLSPFYISKIFKSETGDTPIRHLINIRLERAKQILEEGQGNSIQEVALSVGYDDAYHFSKLFKKRYGMSPSQIKQVK
ncbi:AraC family transcriptional regulator [Lachnospiraceae bacterium OttesenSCG-928-D06]|nr:AraC family transcriptional regulator [Lachnospiraceae bacterium OttesenSCG-928-D06]